MADLTITVSNQLYALGPDVTTPSLWGTFQWGGQWLYSSSGLTTDVEKLVTNAITPTSADTFAVEKALSNSITPSGALVFDTDKALSESLALSFETSDEGLLSGDWNYVFTKPSTNAENRSTATFTEQDRPTTTWTSGVATSTSWSTT